MTRKTDSLNGFERFMGEWGDTVQLSLVALLLIACMFIAMMQNSGIVPLLVALALVVSVLWVFASGAKTRYQLAEAIQKDETKARVTKQKSGYHPPLPDAGTLRKRSASVGVTMLILIVLLTGVFLIGAILLNEASLWAWDAIPPMLIEAGYLIYMGLALTIVIAWFVGLFFSYQAAHVLVDFHLYPLNAIQQYDYHGENPLDMDRAGFIQKAIDFAMMVIVPVVVLGAQFGFHWMELRGVSEPVRYLAAGGTVAIGLFLFIRWIARKKKTTSPDDIENMTYEEKEDDIIYSFGEDSDELREFRANPDSYRRLIYGDDDELDERHQSA